MRLVLDVVMADSPQDLRILPGFGAGVAVIPVAKLRDELSDLLDLAARWTRPMSEDRRRNLMHERLERVLAALPRDGVILSGDEVAQIRHTIHVTSTQVGTGARSAPEVQALIDAALSLLDQTEGT